MATKIPKLLRFSGQVALVTGGSGGIGNSFIRTDNSNFYRIKLNSYCTSNQK